jgi:hypothetical protein
MRKQIGVSLPPGVQEALIELAQNKGYSLSGMAAEAITVYMAPYMAQKQRQLAKKAKNVSLFTGLDIDETIQLLQEAG